MNLRIGKFLKILSVMIVFLGSFVAYDLYYPRTTHLRQFDSYEGETGDGVTQGSGFASSQCHPVALSPHHQLPGT